jgi:tetratricopeptide (TPR) repeat protein
VGVSFAENAYQYARKHLGDTHPDTITSMNNLAGLYKSQGRYGEAEPLYTKALQLCEKVLGKEHPDTITTGLNYISLLINKGSIKAPFRNPGKSWSFDSKQPMGYSIQ